MKYEKEPVQSKENMEEKQMARKVVLAGACRTAIGTMGGSLSTTPAAELGAIVIKEALNRPKKDLLFSVSGA